MSPAKARAAASQIPRFPVFDILPYPCFVFSGVICPVFYMQAENEDPSIASEVSAGKRPQRSQSLNNNKKGAQR
jgi:hypothetical protein